MPVQLCPGHNHALLQQAGLGRVLMLEVMLLPLWWHRPSNGFIPLVQVAAGNVPV